MATSRLSPEVTGHWACPSCGETTQFRGYDDRGYPGISCECGAYESGGVEECSCEATLVQDIDIEDGEPEYRAFVIEGGGDPYDAVIGEYTRIECRACGVEIWPHPPKRRRTVPENWTRADTIAWVERHGGGGGKAATRTALAKRLRIYRQRLEAALTDEDRSWYRPLSRDIVDRMRRIDRRTRRQS